MSGVPELRVLHCNADQGEDNLRVGVDRQLLVEQRGLCGVAGRTSG